MSYLASVDVVITGDKSKWTRCVVLEMSEDSAFSEHLSGKGARKFDRRRAFSVDKNGNTNLTGKKSTNPDDPNYIDSIGMGWFPGYALNLETGERLNICFGENSGDTRNNGRDMKWNPTSKTGDTIPYVKAIGAVFGGQHYIYVFGHNSDDTKRVTRYDAGKRMDSILNLNNGFPMEIVSSPKTKIISDAMWVNIPLLASNHSLFETDVTVRLRVTKSYKKGYSIITDTASVAFGSNRNIPMYTFKTDGIATKVGKTDVLKEALSDINVVPNPYYAFSMYEKSTLENKVKITNLPEQCTVSIFNMSGTLIRRFKKGEASTNHTPKGEGQLEAWHDCSLDWDMKNTVGIPVASGIYFIHVEVPGVGERVIKWFGVMRPIDLDAF